MPVLCNLPKLGIRSIHKGENYFAGVVEEV